MPLKAVRILKEVDLIFTAASTQNDCSLAADIARPHIPEKAKLEGLDFPMSKDKAVMASVWRGHARTIAQSLANGRSAAFLALGDPLTYSTYGSVVLYLQLDWPELTVRTIPGITSYQAAAPATNRALVEGEQSLMIMSGVHGGDKLLNLTTKPDNVVFMKAYRDVAGICRALDDARMLENSVAVNHFFMENQHVITDVTSLCDATPNYWPLVMAGHRTGGEDMETA